MIGNWARMAILIIMIVPNLGAAKRLAVVELSRIDSTTHVEILSDDVWSSSVKDLSAKKERTIRLTVDPIDEASEQKLLGYSDKLIKGVRIDTNGPDGKYDLYFDLKSSTTSVFHYLSDKPARLIMDFYVDDVKLAALRKRRDLASRKKQSQVFDITKLDQLRKKNLTPKEKMTLRRLIAEENARKRLSQDFDISKLDPNSPNFDLGALPELKTPDMPSKSSRLGIFDGGDPQFKRFSMEEDEIDPNAIIRSRRNAYLPFPMLENELKYLEMLEANMPVYKINPAKGEENKMARLLLKLFNNNRQAMFAYTLKMFNEKYPSSRYREITMFMNADLAYKSYMKDSSRENFEFAMERYTVALREYPKSQLVERVLLMKGFAMLKLRNSLGTLAVFGQYMRRFPKSPRIPQVRLAVASAYIHLRRYKEAMQIYNEIAADKSGSHYSKEARYRMGDISFHKKDYRPAVKAYQVAFAQYPADWQSFPNAFYNSGEALFWMGEYKKALDFYRDFLRRFPENQHSGYAMTRIGELMEIMGADKEQVIGAFLETHFRYGKQPGADVAQLRLLSHRMEKMKAKELQKTLAKMYDIGKASYIEGMNQFVTIMVADGFKARKEHDNAIRNLDNFFRQNPTLANRELISARITDNLFHKINNYVDSGDFLEALKTYDEMKGSWLKGNTRIDIPFLVGRAYEQAGAYEKARKFYQQALLRGVDAQKDTEKLKIRKVFEFVPSNASIRLRISSTALRSKDVSGSQDALSKVNIAELTSGEKVERILLASHIAEKMGQKKEAIALLTQFIDKWTGKPIELMPSYLRLGELKSASTDINGAMKAFQQVVLLGNEDVEKDPKSHARAMEQLGNLYLDKGEKEKAFEVWNLMVSRYEKTLPVAAVRYKAGKILFQQGKIQNAMEYWEALKQEDNQLWYDLSREQIKNSKWRDDYKRYIERIPAMAKGEGSTQ